jgi:hypothetical protein
MDSRGSLGVFVVEDGSRCLFLRRINIYMLGRVRI